MAHICEDLNQRLEELKKKLGELDSLAQAVTDADSKSALADLSEKASSVIELVAEKKEGIENLKLNFQEGLAEYLGVSEDKNKELKYCEETGYLKELHISESARADVDLSVLGKLGKLKIDDTSVIRSLRLPEALRVFRVNATRLERINSDIAGEADLTNCKFLIELGVISHELTDIKLADPLDSLSIFETETDWGDDCCKNLKTINSDNSGKADLSMCSNLFKIQFGSSKIKALKVPESVTILYSGRNINSINSDLPDEWDLSGCRNLSEVVCLSSGVKGLKLPESLRFLSRLEVGANVSCVNLERINSEIVGEANLQSYVSLKTLCINAPRIKSLTFPRPETDIYKGIQTGIKLLMIRQGVERVNSVELSAGLDLTSWYSLEDLKVWSEKLTSLKLPHSLNYLSVENCKQLKSVNSNNLGEADFRGLLTCDSDGYGIVNLKGTAVKKVLISESQNKKLHSSIQVFMDSDQKISVE